ncbi:MAG: hypothetical protein ACRDPH_07840 [Marmoricola sp.]
MAAGGFTLGLGTVEAARRAHGIDGTPGAPASVIVLWTDDVDTTYAAGGGGCTGRQGTARRR